MSDPWEERAQAACRDVSRLGTLDVTDHWTGLLLVRAIAEVCRQAYKEGLEQAQHFHDVILAAEGVANAVQPTPKEAREGVTGFVWSERSELAVAQLVDAVEHAMRRSARAGPSQPTMRGSDG